MLYTLKNDCLTVTLNSRGAEVVSVKKNRIEYIWQGDEQYWDGHSPIMFPICGRVWDGKYTYKGRRYEMGVHGFARQSEFSVKTGKKNSITFYLTDSEETLRSYPFRFLLMVEYELRFDTLYVNFTIRNCDNQMIYATLGAHPGFCVPIGGEGDFSDWYLEFGNECSPDQLLLDGSYATGKKRGMTLRNGTILPLSHSLFDEEGIFMHRIDSSVTLKSDRSGHSVQLCYSEMPYFGVWQPAHTDAPFVCLEPWCGFAGYTGEVEDISTKPDMFRIEPCEEINVDYSIRFH